MSDNIDPLIQESVMVAAHVIGPGHHVFLAHSEDGLNSNTFECRVIEFRAGKWRLLAQWPWQAVALAVGAGQPLQIDVLGRDGQVGSLFENSASLAHVDPARAVGPFRGMRILNDSLVAYGMKREVYRRQANGIWLRMTDGMDPAPMSKKLSIAEKMKIRLGDLGGINAISFDATDHMVGFGMRGEIWRIRGDKWAKIDSPTNLMLKDSVQASDRSVYACGQAGTLIRGSEERWELVKYDGPQKLDLCSICNFKELVYIADGHSLRTLVGGELKLVDFGTEDIVPCAVVVCGAEVVLSVAGQEVWESTDGVAWACILG